LELKAAACRDAGDVDNRWAFDLISTALLMRRLRLLDLDGQVPAPVRSVLPLSHS
jgi:hypothetical protein